MAAGEWFHFRVPIRHQDVAVQDMSVACAFREHLSCEAWNCDCPCHGPDWEALDQAEERARKHWDRIQDEIDAAPRGSKGVI